MIFDNPLKRRRPFGGGNTTTDDLDLEALRDQLPDVHEAEDDIDEAIREAERQRAQKEEERSSGCRCW